MADVTAIRVPVAAAVAMTLASVLTLAAFGWPFLFEPAGEARATSHAGDAPWIFAMVLPLLAAIVLAELNAGTIDAKAIALLGMLSAMGGALRALSPGIAGFEPSFALFLLGGRVFGRGFGFVLGALSMFVGALITGGVGPWLPFQMMTAGWVGFLGGCLPRASGKVEIGMLAVLGFFIGLFYGLLMNLWFWPFGNYGDQISFVPGATAAENLVNYVRYYALTSVVWDLARANFTFLLVLFLGTPLLRALRRVSRRAAFDAEARFE
ncbi:ECF transporter S component [Nocardioides sp. AE5]|uniref:ECF transporter S component n=1 Tax=Nocardioides sp. AE5 TaxID=2962573 RepID=UPI002880D03B|nr:ECF transporter S component [Nocardioides sp. AE5]MDT0201761.1 ECF transporter S component [Nocardioides sp. AE5]